MFRRLLQALARGVAAPVIIQNELRDLLGADAAAEVQALQENRLHDEALKKRATGLVALGRVIVSTRGQMKDPDRHRFLWHEIARPGIDARYRASRAGQYDAERFYVDALDYAAAVNMLPDLLKSGQQTLAVRMVDTLLGLNSCFAETGGYFGNTPYWTLHTHPVWRAVDRDVSSVQVYWMIFLVAQELATQIQRSWAQALLEADLEVITSLSDAQRRQILCGDLSVLALALTYGIAAQAARTQAAGPQPSARARALIQTVQTISGDSEYLLQTLFGADTMGFLAAFRLIFNSSHPLHGLPDHGFTLSIRLQEAVRPLVPCLQLIQELLSSPPGQPVLSDARETMPHLLHASL